MKKSGKTSNLHFKKKKKKKNNPVLVETYWRCSTYYCWFFIGNKYTGNSIRLGEPNPKNEVVTKTTISNDATTNENTAIVESEKGKRNEEISKVNQNSTSENKNLVNENTVQNSENKAVVSNTSVSNSIKNKNKIHLLL